MQQVDTEYTSLNDVPEDIREFHSEVSRTRTIGHTEPDEDGVSEPITEDYTVVVLNVPDEVTYEWVHSRRGRKHPWETVTKPSLVQAIEWEYFDVNYTQYLAWKNRPIPERARGDDGQYLQDDVETENVNEAWVDGFIPEDYDAQLRPVVDYEARKACYEVIVLPKVDEFTVELPTYSEQVIDEEYVITRLNDVEPMAQKDIDKVLKLRGVVFEGKNCSATKEDMWGLSSVESTVRAGHDINFDFDSGDTLVLTADNIDAFQAVWVPFRLSFFN